MNTDSDKLLIHVLLTPSAAFDIADYEIQDHLSFKMWVGVPQDLQ